jgi:acetoin utilization deacetylase AcuC-like enzyme
VLVSAGYDAHRADPLGGCLLEAESFAEMTRRVGALADELGAPVGAVLEGGYEPAALARSVRETMLALGDHHEPRPLEAQPAQPAAIAPALEQVSRYWPL